MTRRGFAKRGVLRTGGSLYRGPQMSLAGPSSLLYDSHASLRDFQTVVDTAFESTEARLSNAASTLAWKPRSGERLSFKSELGACALKEWVHDHCHMTTVRDGVPTPRRRYPSAPSPPSIPPHMQQAPSSALPGLSAPLSAAECTPLCQSACKVHVEYMCGTCTPTS